MASIRTSFINREIRSRSLSRINIHGQGRELSERIAWPKINVPLGQMLGKVSSADRYSLSTILLKIPTAEMTNWLATYQNLVGFLSLGNIQSML